MNRRILVGTHDGIHTVDGGVSSIQAGERITSLAAGQDGIWAIANRSTVWLDKEFGETIARFDVAETLLQYVLPIAGGALIGGSRAKLLRATLSDGHAEFEGEDESFAAAPDRESWYTPWGGPPDVRSLAADVDGTTYLNVHVGGILRKTGEEPWQATLDIDADVHQVIAHPEHAGSVLAATAHGLAYSTDGADNWTFVTEGLHAGYCRAVAVGGDTVYLSASTGPGGRAAAVYRADGPGSAFVRCATGLPEWFSTNVDTHCLVAFDDTVIVADASGVVYRSSDRGDTWEVASDDLPPIDCLTA